MPSAYPTGHNRKVGDKDRKVSERETWSRAKVRKYNPDSENVHLIHRREVGPFMKLRLLQYHLDIWTARLRGIPSRL